MLIKSVCAFLVLSFLIGCAEQAGVNYPENEESNVKSIITKTDRQFFLANFSVGQNGTDLAEEASINVLNDGIIINVTNGDPAIGPAQLFPVLPGMVYEVSVTFEVLKLEGKPVFDILSWSKDKDGKPIKVGNAYRTFFQGLDVKTTGKQTIIQSFSVNGQEGTKQIASPDVARFVRFTSNPARVRNRGDRGSVVKIYDISVKVIEPK